MAPWTPLCATFDSASKVKVGEPSSVVQRHEINVSPTKISQPPVVRSNPEAQSLSEFLTVNFFYEDEDNDEAVLLDEDKDVYEDEDDEAETVEAVDAVNASCGWAGFVPS